jgi:hypothetical protein
MVCPPFARPLEPVKVLIILMRGKVMWAMIRYVDTTENHALKNNSI